MSLTQPASRTRGDLWDGGSHEQWSNRHNRRSCGRRFWRPTPTTLNRGSSDRALVGLIRV